MENENKVKQPKKKKRNIIVFFITMVIAMLVFDIVMDQLYPIIAQMILYGKFGRNAIIEAVCAFIILIVVLLFKNSYIFSEKKNGFLKSLMVGGYITVYATILLALSISSTADAKLLDVGSLVIFCLLIGIFEEFLCRGWIQNEFIERFASTRKQVYLSIFLSSLIFGGIHISNIWVGGQSVIETMAQIIQATGMGFLLGAIYFRTKNIWSVVFLHGYWDFALFLREVNVIKECTEGATSVEYKLTLLASSFIVAIVSTLVGFYVLRKSKTQGYIKDEVLTIEEIKKSKRRSSLYVFGAIAAFLSLMFIPDVEGNETCYEYKEKHISYSEVITPVYTEYTIDELNLRITLNEDNKIIFHNLKTNQRVEFKENYIRQFIVLEEDNKYRIMIGGLNKYQTDSVVYYSEYITKDNFKDDENYLNDLNKSFKVIDSAPTTEQLEYIVDSNNRSYFIIVTMNNERMVYVKDELYILVHQENTKTESDKKEESQPEEETQEQQPEETTPVENTTTENNPPIEEDSNTQEQGA